MDCINYKDASNFYYASDIVDRAAGLFKATFNVFTILCRILFCIDKSFAAAINWLKKNSKIDTLLPAE